MKRPVSDTLLLPSLCSCMATSDAFAPPARPPERTAGASAVVDSLATHPRARQLSGRTRVDGCIDAVAARQAAGMSAAVVHVGAAPASTGARAPLKMFAMVDALAADQAPEEFGFGCGVSLAMGASWVLSDPAGALSA